MIGWIDSISVDGEMRIKFNNTLVFNLTNKDTSRRLQSSESNIKFYNETGQNLHWLNDTMISMYLEPERNWHLEEENFNLSKLNFTFNCTKFENSTKPYPESVLYF